MRAFKESEGSKFNEVGHLMKAATGVKDVDLNVVQQISEKISSMKNENINDRNSQVTFFVGQSKASIDLPTEDNLLAVSDSDAAVKVMLSAHSDGIISDVLKTKEPMPHLVVEKRKGRPARATKNR